MLLEEFAPGVEIAVEGLVNDGRLNVLAVFDKPGASQGPFFPETILVTPSRLPGSTLARRDVLPRPRWTPSASPTARSTSSSKSTADRVVVIELAARSIGGLCSKSLNFGLMGTTLETMILRNALGLDKPELHREQVASGVLMVPIPRTGNFIELLNTEAVRALPNVTGLDVTVRRGSSVEPPPEGDRYLGFVYAHGPDPEVVESALVEAQRLLEVVVE